MRLIDGEVQWLAELELTLEQGEFLPCICAAAGDLRVTT